jgi:hypothetical protein
MPLQQRNREFGSIRKQWWWTPSERTRRSRKPSLHASHTSYTNSGHGWNCASGGLSGATTDIARLIATMIDQKDNPALKRATITSMLSDGAALTAAGMGRAGYGFDALVNQGSGNFYGQKGGSLASSGNVLEFNGQWGFALCWGGKATAATSWYPDYPTVMNIAKNAAWGTTDLFPQFGMPSL